MVSNPKLGDTVIIRYKKKLKSWFPLEGKTGTILVVCKARRCRNHGVMVDGKLYAIPCGNLMYPKDRVAAKAQQMELKLQ